jgi:hypothetical protein
MCEIAFFVYFSVKDERMSYRPSKRRSYQQPMRGQRVTGKVFSRFFSAKRTPSPIRLRELLGVNRPIIGFSSHGEWSTLGEIRKVEEERGNCIPKLSDYPASMPAMWICLTRRKALRYLAMADDWERIDDLSKSLTPKFRDMMTDEVSEVKILPTDVIAYADGDDGYLILRPKRKAS